LEHFDLFGWRQLKLDFLAIVFDGEFRLRGLAFGLFLTLFALFLFLLGFLAFRQFLLFRFLALDFLGPVDKSAKIRERRCAIGWLHCCVTCHVVYLCG